MKTIVILIDQLYRHGGIEKLVAIKANYWSENFGYKVIIVSTEQLQNKPIYELSEQVTFIDIDIKYNRSLSFFHPKNFNKLFANLTALKEIIKLQTPDFILVASHLPMTYVLPFLKTEAIIIKEFHYSKFNTPTNRKEYLFSSIEKRYDYLVVLSEEEKTFYAASNVKVIPNPVTIAPRLEIPINKKENIAGALLRFAPVKQLEKMVGIWDLFAKRNNEWKLYIYGDIGNEYFEKIRILVTDKNLEKTIFFKGQTDNIVDALSEMKLMLMTSANECFPLVILEANSCGVPVISFDSPTGPRNIIHHDVDGVIVPLNDVHAFATALYQLSSDYNKLNRLSQAAVQNASHYHLDEIMQIWKEEIFENND